MRVDKRYKHRGMLIKPSPLPVCCHPKTRILKSAHRLYHVGIRAKNFFGAKSCTYVAPGLLGGYYFVSIQEFYSDNCTR